MLFYQEPRLHLLSKLSFPASTATGDVNFIVLLSQVDCCQNQDPEECDFPLGVPLPGSIHVDNGQITLLFGEAQAGCPTSGPIDSNGHFSIDISACFEDGNDCDDSGQEPNACCPRTSIETIIEGTFDGSHLEGTITHQEDVPESDTDCGDINNIDCTDLGTITADPA
jgi:hypothetical protein